MRFLLIVPESKRRGFLLMREDGVKDDDGDKMNRVIW